MRDNAFEKIADAAEMVKGIKEGLDITSSTIEKTIIADKEKLYPENLCRELKEIIARMAEVYADLQKPCLRLAFIGPTSSGKSTLLNGLIGQTIAPIEAAQMSAGVVRIRNGKDIEMEVLETSDMKWEKGKYDVHSVDRIYELSKGIMLQYHDAVKEDMKIKAPRIDIKLPIAPKNGGIPSSMINIPDGIELELIDLPGLKTVVDPLNMEVIQQNLVGAFLLIVLNYSETDDDKINKLLSEIKRTVDAICRNKKALLFILNRVDLRMSTDNPLEERISRLEKEIKEKLDLPEDPLIIPMSSLPLYYLQVSWGAEEKPLFKRGGEKESLKYIQSFFDDCGKIIRQMEKSSSEKEDWFERHTWRNIDTWTDTEIQQLVYWVYEHSGASEFWRALQEKLDENIGAVIINPALRNTVSLLEDFSRSAQGILEVRKLSTDTEIVRQLEIVKSLAEEIKKKLKLHKEKLHKELKESVENCKAGLVPPPISQFKEMETVRININNDVLDNLFTPVFDCILCNSDDEAVEELEKGLSEHIPQQMAIDIRRAINNLIKADYKEYAKDGHEIKVDAKRRNQEILDKVDNLRRIQERLLNVYKCVSEAAEIRCQLLLQEKVNFFITMIKDITSEAMKDLAKELRENNLDKTDIASLLIPPARGDENEKKVDLTGIKAISKAWTQELDKRKKNFIEKIKDIFDRLRGKPVDLSKEVPVVIFKLHSVDESKAHLTKWLEGTLERIWEILGDEVGKIIEEEMEDYGRSLEKSEDQIKEALMRQFELIKQELTGILAQTQETADQISREETRYEEFQREILKDS